MNEKLEVLSEKWQDIYESADPEEYEVRSLAQEVLEDIAWLKNSLR